MNTLNVEKMIPECIAAAQWQKKKKKKSKVWDEVEKAREIDYELTLRTEKYQ